MNKFLASIRVILTHTYALVGLFLVGVYVVDAANFHKFQYQVTLFQLQQQGGASPTSHKTHHDGETTA